MQFVWFLTAGSLDIYTHSIPTLHEPELLFPMISLQLPWTVQWESCCIFASYVQIVIGLQMDPRILDIAPERDPHPLLPSPH